MFKKYIYDEVKHKHERFKNLISFSYTYLEDEPSYIHAHSNCEIIIPLNESGYLICEGKTIELLVNNIYIINSNVMHTEKNKPNNNLRYYALRLGVNVIEAKNECVRVSNVSAYKEITFYLNKAYKEFEENKNSTLGKLNLEASNLLIISILKNEGLTINNLHPKVIPSSIVEVEKYLRNNYEKSISISSVAKKFLINQTTLENQFKKYYLNKPIEYLTQIRINAAKDLLVTSNYSINQISSMCGFKSPSFFTKTFKSKTKKLPKEYRHQSTMN